MPIATIVGQVAPPMAIALAIMRASRRGRAAPRVLGEPAVPLRHVPFLLLLMAVPELATWLPSTIRE